MLRTRAELSQRYADLVYNGQWFTPLRHALQAFFDATTEDATGEVAVELHQGRAAVCGRTSPNTLYRPDLASFDMTGYQPKHAEGFIRLFGLPGATGARRGGGSATRRPAEVLAND